MGAAVRGTHGLLPLLSQLAWPFNAAVDLAHRAIVRVVVRIERYESLVEKPQFTYFAQFPQLSIVEAVPFVGALSADLDGAKHFVVLSRNAVTVRLDDAKESVMHELESAS